VFIALLLIQASPAPAPDLPIDAGTFAQACVSSGGSAGFRPAHAGTTVDLYQIGPAVKVQINVWTEGSANSKVWWLNEAGKRIDRTLVGTETTMFTATSAVLQIGGDKFPVSWCIHYR